MYHGSWQSRVSCAHDALHVEPLPLTTAPSLPPGSVFRATSPLECPAQRRGVARDRCVDGVAVRRVGRCSRARCTGAMPRDEGGRPRTLPPPPTRSEFVQRRRASAARRALGCSAFSVVGTGAGAGDPVVAMGLFVVVVRRQGSFARLIRPGVDFSAPRPSHNHSLMSVRRTSRLSKCIAVCSLRVPLGPRERLCVHIDANVACRL